MTKTGTTCTACFSGFQLITTTTPRICRALPYNCRVMNSAGTCTSCVSSTTLRAQTIPTGINYPSNLQIPRNATLCINTTANCLYYNIYGLCEICNTNFTQIKHQCVPVTICQFPVRISNVPRCIFCKQGYEFDMITLTCYPKIEGCSIYHSTTRVCTLCTSNYLLRNGICFFRNPNCL